MFKALVMIHIKITKQKNVRRCLKVTYCYKYFLIYCSPEKNESDTGERDVIMKVKST